MRLTCRNAKHEYYSNYPLNYSDQLLKFRHMSTEKEDSGMEDMLNKIGKAYYRGFGVKQDHERAVCFFKKAASMGNAEAMFHLGQCLEEGDGIERDVQRAFDCYSDAVRAGSVAAMIRIGDLYWNGYENLVVKDREISAEWYEQALLHAEDHPESIDLPNACIRVADCLKDGIGMEKNRRKAHALYRTALEQLHQKMTYALCFDGTLLERAEQGCEECASSLCLSAEKSPRILC